LNLFKAIQGKMLGKTTCKIRESWVVCFLAYYVLLIAYMTKKRDECRAKQKKSNGKIAKLHFADKEYTI